ncbi:DUF5007 domain-containing protein [Maribellus sediminis]|uniref:DUF5007 domain-containing protein n=1 Tax=Maribellus sediminis TaxID=2696285 RepID=UPI00142F78AC|nr:DUF5007 domain-containing protein [Maribellus sediminis]
MKKLLYIFSILIAASSCVQPEVGYISDNIHALEDTVFVPRGSFMTSAAPAAEGSTYPLKWVITDVQDENGNSTNELFEEHEILIWTSAFNPDTDTTLALAEEKLELSMQPTLLINDVSGELAFTQASKFVENDIFNIDVNVSNVRGDRQLDSFVVVKMMPFAPVEFPTEMRSRNNLIKTNGSKYDLATAKIMNDYDDGVPSVLDGTHPYFSVTKASDEPSLGIKVIMTVTDSHDQPIPASKIAFYPSGASYLQNFHDNSTETVQSEFSTSFSLPAPPFPQFGRNYSGNSSYLMYYISTRDAFTVDKEAYEADKGAMDWSQFKVNETTGNIVCEAYIRWGIKINDSGTWNIKMRIPYSKVIQ